MFNRYCIVNVVVDYFLVVSLVNFTFGMWMGILRSFLLYSLHRRSIEQIIEIPNTTYVATASSDTTIKIFDYRQLSVKNELVGGHQTNVSCISCTNNLNIFLALLKICNSMGY